jgi:hypothetical protein
MDELTSELSNLSIGTEIITNPLGNKGEQDEYSFKKEVFDNKNNIPYCETLFGEKGLNGVELLDLSGRPYENIKQIQRKAKSKVDVTVLLKGPNEPQYISIKSSRGANPSLLNHTPRSAWVFQHGPLKKDLPYLDLLAKEYHSKRITEDVKLSQFISNENKQSVLNMLVYFIFKGTGTRKSPQECNSILLMNKDGTKTFIYCNIEEERYTYVLGLLDRCILSFRNKGMKKEPNEQDLPWIGTYHNKGYGAIHVRLSAKAAK